MFFSEEETDEFPLGFTFLRQRFAEKGMVLEN